MVEVALLLAVALLVCGVLASFVPLAPGALLSLAGIYGYWWATGYSEPGTVFLVVATFVGLGTLALDYLASALSTRAGGASWKTTAIAAVVGLALLPFTGPVGAVVGVALAVFALEFKSTGDLEGSLRTAWYTLLGILLSKGLQVLLTGTLLVGFLFVVW
ncbi:DUF456 domain-containing protein [Halalkalicoccus tibetensis]|uniref:DUF456 domain-containing protein n=1 Tax=Halalkalicoccus tibetensis TaxID=175632 RepID=A0ABD5V1J3_9EURY